MGKQQSRILKRILRLEKSLSQNSIDAYINDINKLIKYLDSQNKKILPTQVEYEHLKSFVAWINDAGTSPRTQARVISGIKSFFKYLLLEGIIDRNPTSLLEAPKVGRKTSEYLNCRRNRHSC